MTIALAIRSVLKVRSKATRSSDNIAHRRVMEPTKTGIRAQASNDRNGNGEKNMLGTQRASIMKKKMPTGVRATLFNCRQ